MATALMSLVTGRPVRDDMAMTGELTLTGPGAADRRPEGEGAGRPAGGRAARAGAQPQRARPRGHPRGAAQEPGLRLGRRDRRRVRCRTRKWPTRVCSARESELESESSEGAMANKKVQKAGKAAQTARSNPYVQRLIEDEDLRQNIVAGLRVGSRRLCAAEQRQEPDEADLRRQEAAEAHQGGRGQRPRRQRGAARGAEEAEERRRPRPRPAARHRRRRGRARALRGPAQEGARRAVRRRGGVRVHLDHLVAIQYAGAARRPAAETSREGAHRAPSFVS